MSQRWLKFLEKFGARTKSTDSILEPSELERAVTSPKQFERYDVLFHLFGPMPDSPWVPYHCPTLFASIDKLNITPRKIELSSGYHEEHPPGSWQWVAPDTMVIVDIPDGAAVEVGVTLMKHGAQPICTFDHWPFLYSVMMTRSARPVIQSRPVIDTMYTLAHEVFEIRKDLSPDAAPIWICDDRRLGDGLVEPAPGSFDNRYYIDDSILPGIRTLKEAHIRRVVHLRLKEGDDPLPDLVPFLIEAHDAGIDLEYVTLRDKSTWSQPKSMRKPMKRKLPIRGFRRSDMGGFGKLVPEPSEGGYSSGGGGG